MTYVPANQFEVALTLGRQNYILGCLVNRTEGKEIFVGYDEADGIDPNAFLLSITENAGGYIVSLIPRPLDYTFRERVVYAETISET